MMLHVPSHKLLGIKPPKLAKPTRRAFLAGAAMSIATPAIVRADALTANYRQNTIQGPQPYIMQQGAWGNDIDDLAGMMMYVDAIQQGAMTLVYAGTNSGNEYSARCMASCLNYSGINLPRMGKWMGGLVDPTGAVISGIVSAFLTSTANAFPAPWQKAVGSGVDVMRQVLAACPNNSLRYSNNGLATCDWSLWNSPGDDISPLTGEELLLQKVNTFIITEGNAGGSTSEYNTLNTPYWMGNWVNTITSHANSLIPILGLGTEIQPLFSYPFPYTNSATNPYAEGFKVYSGNAAGTHGSGGPSCAMVTCGLYPQYWTPNPTHSNGTNTVNTSTGVQAWTSPAGNWTYVAYAAGFPSATWASLITTKVAELLGPLYQFPAPPYSGA